MPRPSPDDDDENAPHLPGDALDPAITFSDPSDPFTPTPLVTELLRTRQCVPGSILLVEDVAVAPLARSEIWRAIRLVLGDGELCIQALLHPKMHHLVDDGTVDEGCYVRLGAFSIEHRDIKNDGAGGPAQMVYLVVDELTAVGWRAFASSPTEPVPDEDTPDNAQEPDEEQGLPAGQQEEGQEQEEEEVDLIPSSQIEFDDWISQARQGTEDGVHRTPTKSRPLQRPPIENTDDEDEDDFDADDFEEMLASPSKTARRREQAAEVAASHARHPPVALPRDWLHPSIPLKLTPLRSIPHLPYKQNWSVNALVIITALDDVQPCPVPPFVMRTARVADPSTAKRILLTVFLDPAEFAPRVGSVVLLVGVKNHLFDGGSLKKYVSDRPTRPGERWWYEEPRDLAWCDVDGVRGWWEAEGKMMADEGA